MAQLYRLKASGQLYWGEQFQGRPTKFFDQWRYDSDGLSTARSVLIDSETGMGTVSVEPGSWVITPLDPVPDGFGVYSPEGFAEATEPVRPPQGSPQADTDPGPSKMALSKAIGELQVASLASGREIQSLLDSFHVLASKLDTDGIPAQLAEIRKGLAKIIRASIESLEAKLRSEIQAVDQRTRKDYDDLANMIKNVDVSYHAAWSTKVAEDTARLGLAIEASEKRNAGRIDNLQRELEVLANGHAELVNRVRLITRQKIQQVYPGQETGTGSADPWQDEAARASLLADIQGSAGQLSPDSVKYLEAVSKALGYVALHRHHIRIQDMADRVEGLARELHAAIDHISDEAWNPRIHNHPVIQESGTELIAAVLQILTGDHKE